MTCSTTLNMKKDCDNHTIKKVISVKHTVKDLAPYILEVSYSPFSHFK